MKVLLLKDVPKIGRKSDVKEVAEGFARNKLFPQGLAMPATPERIREVAEGRMRLVHVAEAREAEVREFCARSRETPLVMRLPANEKGNLFKGVQVADIVALMKTQGLVLEAKEVLLKNPLKEVGVHHISLRVGAVSGECVVSIEKK